MDSCCELILNTHNKPTVLNHRSVQTADDEKACWADKLKCVLIQVFLILFSSHFSFQNNWYHFPDFDYVVLYFSFWFHNPVWNCTELYKPVFLSKTRKRAGPNFSSLDQRRLWKWRNRIERRFNINLPDVMD